MKDRHEQTMTYAEKLLKDMHDQLKAFDDALDNDNRLGV